MKVITNIELVTATGIVMRSSRTGIPMPNAPEESLIDCTLALACRDFCLALWTAAKSFQGSYADAKSADRIIDACQKQGQKKTFALEEADWEWLTKKMEEHGPTIFGEKTPRILEPLKNFIEEMAPENGAGTKLAKAKA